MKTSYLDKRTKPTARLHSVAICALVALLLAGCYGMRRSKGGGQIAAVSQRKLDTAAIAIARGYTITPVITDLTFPTACDFDDQGRLYVIEAGYSYGEVWTAPRLIRIDGDNSKTVIATGDKNGPWTGLVYHDGNFYVAEGGQLNGGKILRIGMDGKITALVSDLPAFGDHHTNGPAIKGDYIYFGQGAATNSGVVGPDNAKFGWLKRKPDFHDIPCQDIELAGHNFESADTAATNRKVVTGAYSAFGTTTRPGQVIKGKVPCTGAIMRIPLQGAHPSSLPGACAIRMACASMPTANCL